MTKLINIYNSLFERFGNQYWWPGETPWEIAVGAILTQQVAWKNVEKAIINLGNENILELEKMISADAGLIKMCIYPAGFFNQKTKNLLNFENYVFENYASIEIMLTQPVLVVRKELLSLKGIGPETADSILCYAGSFPIFVVDAYTKRLVRCISFSETEDYHKIQKLFMDELHGDNELYNELHALIVKLGKEFCKKKNPLCENCPVRKYSSSNKLDV